MIISNYLNKYLKLESSYISQIIADPTGFTEIQLTGNLNCCKTGSTETEFLGTIDLASTSWYLDLATPVGLGSDLVQLNIVNTTTQLEYNLLSLSGSFSLAYVNDDCETESCSLEDYPDSLTDLAASINAWFESKLLTTAVAVSAEGNVLVISGLPTGFILSGAYYDTVAAETQLIATYGAVGAKWFILPTGLYITPAFFNLDKLLDGVYKIGMKIITLSEEDVAGYVYEQNCAFIDIETRCIVATTLVQLRNEAARRTMEPYAKTIHLLHYSLTNGSNCGCNCADLCTIYRELYKLLIDENQLLDCGC